MVHNDFELPKSSWPFLKVEPVRRRLEDINVGHTLGDDVVEMRDQGIEVEICKRSVVVVGSRVAEGLQAFEIQLSPVLESEIQASITVCQRLRYPHSLTSHVLTRIRDGLMKGLLRHDRLEVIGGKECFVVPEEIPSLTGCFDH